MHGPEDAPSMRALAREGKILPDDQISSTLIPLYGWRNAKEEPFMYAECLKFETEVHLRNGDLEKATLCYKEALKQHSSEAKQIAMRMSILGCFKEIYNILKEDMEETDRQDLENIEKPIGQLVNFDNLLREQVFDWALQCSALISKLYPEDSPYSKDFKERNEDIKRISNLEKPDWSRVSLKINEQSILLSTLANETPESAFEKTLGNWLD